MSGISVLSARNNNKKKVAYSLTHRKRKGMSGISYTHTTWIFVSRVAAELAPSLLRLKLKPLDRVRGPSSKRVINRLLRLYNLCHQMCSLRICLLVSFELWLMAHQSIVTSWCSVQFVFLQKTKLCCWVMQKLQKEEISFRVFCWIPSSFFPCLSAASVLPAMLQGMRVVDFVYYWHSSIEEGKEK